MRQDQTDLLYAIGDDAMQPLGGKAELLLPAGQWMRFDLTSGGCWYGHGFAHRQPYPLNAEPIVNERFAVNNTQSPIWMCSAGFAILAETRELLSVRCNADGSGRLEFMCPDKPVSIRFFRGKDLPDAHRQLMAHLGWPPPAPEKSLFGDSIFCTWTQYPKCITQERVLDMARAIREHGYPCSVLTLDEDWEAVVGNLAFSRDFPDPRGMVQQLHDMSFRVWLWVAPFINQEAETFPLLAQKGFLVRRKNSPEPSLLKWWGGTAGLVDLSNPAARNWFRDRLLTIKAETGVDGFKIDGGDGKYQPPVADSQWHDYKGPSAFNDLLLSLFDDISPSACETRTVWLSQRRRVIWRQGGKDSHWGLDNGLPAMVTYGLQMALLGYDVFIPDMIPGRVQTVISDMALPSDELMIRWTEASAFMPIMQFSYLPWNYRPETDAIVRQYALLHKALEDYLSQQARSRKAPLYRPLWYDHPDVDELYTVGDEFLLGSDLLAAPVLSQTQVARDVVLPPGRWRDAWTGDVHESRRLLQHPAPCPGIPVFVRAENKPLFAALHEHLLAIPRGSVPFGLTSATYQCGVNRDLRVTG